MSSEVDLLELPELIAEALGISTFAGGILLSALFLLMFLLPVAIWGDETKSSMLLSMMIGFPLMSFLVAIAFLPSWVMVMTVLMVAGMYALIWKGAVS